MGDARLLSGSSSPACRRSKKSSAEAEALGRSRGGFSTKVHVACDALGNPLQIVLTTGQAGDCLQAEPLLERVVAGPEPETSDFEPSGSETSDSETPDSGQTPALGAVLADRGYDSNDLLKYVASLEAEAVIPAKKNRTIRRSLN